LEATINQECDLKGGCLSWQPPGTAESQVPNFLFDCGEVTNTPGTGSMDTSDPMLLPILDFPMLEGFGHQAQPPQNEPLSARGTKANMFKDNNNPQASGVVGARLSPVPAPPPLPMALETRPKVEAMLLFAPGFEPVDLSGVQEVSVSSMISRAPYIPVSKTASVESPPKLEAYVYSAMPPETVKLETLDTTKPDDKGDKEPTDNSDSKKKADPGREYRIVSGSLGNKQGSPTGQPSAMEGANADLAAGKTQQAPGKKDSPNVIGGGNGSQLESNKNGDRSSSVQSPVATLATELECALLQVAMCRSQDTSSSVSSSGTTKATPMLAKESSSDITQVQSDVLQSGRSLSRPQQQERRKKVPERIAGHGADEDMHEGGSRAAQVGVWRPVGAPKPPSSQQSNATTTATTTHNSMAADSRLGLLSNSNCAAETAAGVDEGCAVTGAAARQSQWQEVLNALPLLAQQASITVDAALDGDYGDGPLSWLASQELRKQQRTCGNHVGCGGMLSVAHCLDQSGVELMNPLTAEVSAATVASLLQSDVRIALSNAFGETSMDGPLALVDWCRGRVQMSDGGHFSESTVTDSKEVSSTITVVGEPITPPQLGGGLKAAADMDVDIRRSSSSSSSRVLENSSLSEQTENCQKRGGLGDDLGMLESDVLTSHGPTILALPIPALLVGYQDDWLKTSSSTLHLWEKAPLEPYAPPKQVSHSRRSQL
jgi:mediator of RNA polymerase II transcription subunit 13